MKFDNLSIEILEDGTIKSTSDAVSSPNHSNAEQFLKYMATLAGGETTSERRKDVQAHTHTHDHEQEHE